MALHPKAGQAASPEQLVNVARLVSDYYRTIPTPSDAAQAVSFGTSGHRGTSSAATFNEVHILAICQALVEYRQEQGTTGPMFIGMDTHALSEAAFVSAIEVLVANGVHVIVQQDRGLTPTPVISHAILHHNAKHDAKADGVVITPSHNPPEDGGFKYNPSHGGPADSDATGAIQVRANQLIAQNLRDVKRVSFVQAKASDLFEETDFSQVYIEQLGDVIDMQAIAKAGLRLGTDPLGGSGIYYWQKIAKHYGLDITVVNPKLDHQFSFMHRDKDGKLRMDCSSPYAMAGLIKLKDEYDLAFGNDPDFDRHGIVTPSVGLMNPNHYLAVAIDYLYRHRPEWSQSLAVGKTLVSSSLIDRVCTGLGRQLTEMPVGFKWFVQGLLTHDIAFAGEESAGGIFIRRNGQPWATDKDGFIMALLAAEIKAVTGKDPGQYYQELTAKYGEPVYKRVDVAATFEQKKVLSQMSKDVITSTKLAGEPIQLIQTHAPGNNSAIGGVKVSTENGWFAARPSGTENVYKIYAESFKGDAHLQNLLQEAEALVSAVFKSSNV